MSITSAQFNSLQDLRRRIYAKAKAKAEASWCVFQGALQLILEPIFEADFQPGSYGYRPGRTAYSAHHDHRIRGS